MVRALYEGPSRPDDDELAALGLPADFAHAAERKPVVVYRTNCQAVRLFQAVCHKWHYVGLSATPVGLIYSEVESVMRMKAIPESERPRLFDQLQVMEAEALKHLRETTD